MVPGNGKSNGTMILHGNPKFEEIRFHFFLFCQYQMGACFSYRLKISTVKTFLKILNSRQLDLAVHAVNGGAESHFVPPHCKIM